MVALYVTSMGDGAGNGALCAGLGRRLMADGKKVGFLKPVCASPEGTNRDADIMKQVLDLDDPVESLCGTSGSAADMAATADEKEPTWLKEVNAAFSKVSRGKDVVLLEGLGGVNAGSDSARVAGRVVDALKARAILLVGCGADVDPDQVVAAAKMLGDSLLGVVINAVPERRMESMRTRMAPALEQNGVRVLGVLPEKRTMYAVTVGELAEHVGGSILNSQDRAGELVENVMVGAMSADSALSYLTLKANKAVITRGDRPDIQLAALETSTKCLVLTGGTDPSHGILSRALELEVPIVLVDGDTVSTMEAVEGVFEKAAPYSDRKLERLDSMLEHYLDIEAVRQAC